MSTETKVKELIKNTLPKGKSFQLRWQPVGFGPYRVLRVVTPAWRSLPLFQRILKLQSALTDALTPDCRSPKLLGRVRALLSLPALSSAVFALGYMARAELVYSNNFDGPLGTTFGEWSSSAIVYSNQLKPPGSGWLPAPTVSNTASPTRSQIFLGLFGGPAFGKPADAGWQKTRVDQTISLNLSNLPPHTALLITFDLYIIRSWDGDSPAYGPDRFVLAIAGGPTLLNTTFSNNPKVQKDLSYQSYPVAHSPPRTGAAAIGTLGYESFFRDAIYRLHYHFSHTNAQVRVDFRSSLFEGKGVNDEAWGLDNVIVATISDAEK